MKSLLAQRLNNIVSAKYGVWQAAEGGGSFRGFRSDNSKAVTRGGGGGIVFLCKCRGCTPGLSHILSLITNLRNDSKHG